MVTQRLPQQPWFYFSRWEAAFSVAISEFVLAGVPHKLCLEEGDVLGRRPYQIAGTRGLATPSPSGFGFGPS
jgi:hypothetical protein